MDIAEGMDYTAEKLKNILRAAGVHAEGTSPEQVRRSRARVKAEAKMVSLREMMTTSFPKDMEET